MSCHIPRLSAKDNATNNNAKAVFRNAQIHAIDVSIDDALKR
jgi:hypothetical protein